MEWNFGADVFLTSIATEYLELPAFYYLVKWKSFNTFVAGFFIFNCLPEFYNSIHEWWNCINLLQIN